MYEEELRSNMYLTCWMPRTLQKTSANAGLKILEQLLRWRGEVLHNSVHGKFGTESILKSRVR